MNAAGVLQSTDVVGGSFLLLFATTAATAVLLLLGTGWAQRKWKLPVALSAIAMVVAALQYLQINAIWVNAHHMPVIYRYIGWMITLPLQVAVLYFYIAVQATLPYGLFWRLLVVAVVTVLARYMGEVGFFYPTLGFMIGLAGWLYILGEVFFGRISEVNSRSGSHPSQVGFFWLRLIVSVGWAVYPLCNFIGSFAGGINEGGMTVIYNLADLVNLVAFGLIVLTAAMRESTSVR
jgi:bacteriorhodopsin